MKFISKHWKLITILMLILLAMSASGYKVTSATTYPGITIFPGTGSPTRVVILDYVYVNPAPRAYEWFPINSVTMAVDSDFFPKTYDSVPSWGRHAALSATNGDCPYQCGSCTYQVAEKYHTDHTVTFHDMWGGYSGGTNLPVDDPAHVDGYYSSTMIDDGYSGEAKYSYIFTNMESGALEYQEFMNDFAKSKTSFKDVNMEAGTEEDPKATVYTNWVYQGPSALKIVKS